MPGMMPWGFRQGSRSEYLALYILSALGIATKVPREEDVGVDFHCSLMELQGRNCVPRGAYNVQVKSVSEKERIKYGGLNGAGEWKEYEINWLFSQEVPLLIGLADKESMILHLYSTSNMWYAKYQAGNPGEVHLRPDEPPGQGADVPQPISEPGGWPSQRSDGNRWQVPLGMPLVSIGLADVEDEARLVKYRGILEQAIREEQANIIYGRLKVHWTRWPCLITTNRAFDAQGFSLAGNSTVGANTDAQLEALCPIVAALAYNYKLQNRLSELEMLRGIVELAALTCAGSAAFEMLKRVVPELLPRSSSTSSIAP